MGGIDILAELPVLLLVAESQVESQKGNDEEKGRVAAKMDGKGLEVAGIVVEEDLGARGVSSTPGEEVHGDADRLLGLASDVSGKHTHSETLRGPESEDNPVTDEEAGAGSTVLVLDSHDDNSTNESPSIELGQCDLNVCWRNLRNHEYSHGEQILFRLLDHPG